MPGSANYFTAVAAAGFVSNNNDNGTGPAPSDIAALVTALGGNASVLAIYDRRTGIAYGAGGVSSWADARGSSGFGPTLAQATTAQRPTGGGSPVLFNGTATQNIGCAPIAAFVANVPISICLVGAITGGPGFNYGMALADSSVTTSRLGIANQGGTAKYGAQGGNTVVTAGTTIVSDTRVRAVLAAINATPAVTCQVIGGTQVTTTIVGANTAANAGLTFGGLISNHTNATCAVSAGLVLAGLWSVGQASALLAWAIANHNAISGATA